MLHGVDLNSYKLDQGLNLNNIQFDFAIMKATGGNGYVDPSCDVFYQQAKALGKPRAVYHYFSDGFNDGDPIAEANWFVDNCLGYVGDAILILDWERGGNPDVTNVGKAKAWLDQVFARTGVRPLIYMSTSLTTELDWSSVIAANYGLWSAAYIYNNTPIPNYQMDSAKDPNPNWDGQVNDVIWQFTSTGRIDGFGGNLDCNFFYGNEETWNAYARSTTVPEPTTTTTTEAPAPEPTTTTTTVAPEPTTTTTTETPVEPVPDPTTTTTTTTEVEPPSSTTTTTIADGATPPPTNPWAKVIAFIVTAVLALLAYLSNH